MRCRPRIVYQRAAQRRFDDGHRYADRGVPAGQFRTAPSPAKILAERFGPVFTPCDPSRDCEVEIDLVPT